MTTLPAGIDAAAVFSIPLRTRFRGITQREGLLIHGPGGWGEFSPFVEYPPEEAAHWLASALEQAHGVGSRLVRDVVPVNCIVPAVDPLRAVQLVRASGCRTAKVKVAAPGETTEHDVARVAAVREALGPTGKLRIDANGGWDVPTARQLVRELQQFDLEYVEQPCATVDELAQLRTHVDVPIAADESVRRADDPLRVTRAGAADIVVLKVQPLGGVRRALQIAQACGVPVVVSSAVDTSVGLSAGLALAAALGDLPYACGLATTQLMTGDVVHDPLTPTDGQLRVRSCTVDDDALRSFAAPPERAAWWLDRMAAAYEVLSSWRAAEPQTGGQR